MKHVFVGSRPVCSLTWFALVALVCGAGCGGGDSRWDISGNVTYGGQPVAEGQISFDPVESGTGGGFAPIVDGHYDTAREGRSHPGGPHRVQIVGYRGLVNASDPDSDVALLFPPYETTVELPTHRTTMDFDVPADRRP